MSLTRRRFVGSAVGLGVLSAVGLRPRSLWAVVDGATGEGPRVVEHHLTIDRLGLSIGGSTGRAVAFDQMVPGPLLRLREGEEAVIHVTNHLDEETSVHWHGLLLPFDQDGVPGFSFDGIKPGETFTYRFPVRQAGTYWYHSHSGGQEQKGMYAPLVIEPAGADPVAYDRDHIIVLSDWTDEDPMEVVRNLKGDGGYYNYGKRTLPGLLGGLFGDAGATLRDREGWGRMRMDPTDLADVTGATYTYLLNGRTAEDNWTGLFRPGERVRLRFINAAAMSYFDVKIPGLRMTVVQADGQDVEPVVVDELHMTVAETYDVVVQPEADVAYTIFAQTMDRSGFVRGTLAERDGAVAPIPDLDERRPRSMADMPGMSGHEMMPGMDMPTGTDPSPIAVATDHGAMDMGPKRLTYGDLRALVPNQDLREPERDIVLRLTGDMDRYFWSLNDKKYSESDPITIRLGERVRLVMINETMMEHPMHLHGVFMELQNGQPRELAPRKHVIDVRPNETVEAHLTFDEPGSWALHCHLLYHMMTGMFVRVDVVDTEQE
jgi:CopA family copper-resistance protein